MSNLPTQRLANLLETLANGDAESFEVDVAKLVGELRANVDGIKGLLDDLALVEGWFKARAKPLQSAIKACQRESERLRWGVKEAMLSQGFEKCPGTEYRAQLNDTAEHVEWLDMTPTMSYRSLYPGLVKMQLAWDKEAVEKHLKAGNFLPFARLKRSKALQFYMNTEGMINGVKDSTKRASKSSKSRLSAAGTDTKSLTAGDQADARALHADHDVNHTLDAGTGGVRSQ